MIEQGRAKEDTTSSTEPGKLYVFNAKYRDLGAMEALWGRYVLGFANHIKSDTRLLYRLTRGSPSG